MSKKMKVFTWLALLLLLVVPTGAVAAQGLEDGQIVVAGTFTLESGETLNGDLVVIGGAATIQEGAVVNGSTVLMGGSLVVNGEINGDVLVMGGSVILGEKSIIHRDLTTLGASLVRAEGAVIEGEIFNSATSYGNGTNGDHPIFPDIPIIRPIDVIRIDLFQIVGGVISRAIVLGLLAMLVAVLLPEPTRRVAQAAMAQPVISGGLGLLTLVVLPFALVAMAITLILIPVTPLLVIFVVIVALYGWIALGTEIGVRLSKGNWSMPLAAGLGTFLLTLVVDGMANTPVLACVGWPALILLGIVALGAVFTSRFGSHVVLPAAAPVKVEPVVVEPVVPEEPIVEAPAHKRRTKKEE
jgi:cytoskeletal protein CcmA (bactofilin family)